MVLPPDTLREGLRQMSHPQKHAQPETHLLSLAAKEQNAEPTRARNEVVQSNAARVLQDGHGDSSLSNGNIGSRLQSLRGRLLAPRRPSAASAGHGSYLGISCRHWGWRATAEDDPTATLAARVRCNAACSHPGPRRNLLFLLPISNSGARARLYQRRCSLAVPK